MWRIPITTDPKRARRAFILLVVLALAMIPLAAGSIILEDWWLVAICVYAEADITTTAMRHYIVGWPGSRLDPCRQFLSIRISNAQWLLAGLVIVTATPVALVVIGHARNRALLAIFALVPVVWSFRFVRAMRKEGWRGKKDDAPQARL